MSTPFLTHARSIIMDSDEDFHCVSSVLFPVRATRSEATTPPSATILTLSVLFYMVIWIFAEFPGQRVAYVLI